MRFALVRQNYNQNSFLTYKCGVSLKAVSSAAVAEVTWDAVSDIQE